MNRGALRVAGYRFGLTFGVRWRGYLSIVVLIGLTGGLAMGALVIARQTQSSFDVAARRVNSSDYFTQTRVFNPTIGLNTGYDPRVLDAIAHLSHVRNVESAVGLNVGPIDANGVPLPASDGIAGTGSVDGEFFDQDRVVIAQGRMADPRRADEFVIDPTTAKAFGIGVGEVVSFGAWTNAQTLLPPSGEAPSPAPYRRFSARLVGITGVQVHEAVQDDVDAGNGALVLFTPGLTRQLLACCADATVSGIQLVGGSRQVAGVNASIARVARTGLPFGSLRLSVIRATAERALKPESVAVGVFGLIAALAALLISGQVIGRQIRGGGGDLAVLRALGADPSMTMIDALFGVACSVLAGSLLAVVVALGVSPLAPLGPFRRFVHSGVYADGVVLGVGLTVLVVCLGGFAVAVAYLDAPHRSARRRQWSTPRRSGVARAAAAAGLPVSAVTGVRFALEPGAGRATVPSRSAIIGAALAMVVLTTTIIFGTSLKTLVSQPALYGWNWDYEINGGGGVGVIAEQAAAKLLNGDPYIGAWAGYYFSVLQIDGHDVPVIGGTPGAAVSPPILSGHGLNAPGEVVLGAQTLAQLHKRVGDSINVGVRGAGSTTLRIVGTATMPAIGIGGAQHLEMGDGALLQYSLIPAAARNIYDQPNPGPNVILVRLRHGTDRAAGFRSLTSIVTTLAGHESSRSVVSVQHPAEIINYRALGTTPTILGAALAAGALSGLGLTLLATVRRRRRDLAVMKTLGFTGKQLAATVAWQSTTAVLIGTLVGMPLGIALGRTLWEQFANEIHAVPRPAIPVATLVLVAVGALLIANIVAAIPARIAAHTPTALLLRTE
ncbi:MAG: FtsX-like permease family protein [Pseudonocardiales bacterium]